MFLEWGCLNLEFLKPVEKEFVDTVPFGCFRRSLFDEIGFLMRKSQEMKI